MEKMDECYEHVTCPNCNDGHYLIKHISKDFLFSNEKFTVVRCHLCGLDYTNPRVKESQIAHYYFSGYIQHKEIKQSSTFKRNINRLGHLFGDPHKKILQALKNNNAETVLDVGAGSGELLSILKEKSFKVTGVEKDSTCVERIRAKDIDCYCGDLSEVMSEIGSKKFDAVVFHHAFEHLYNPKETLSMVYKLLNEKGIIYISLPNISSAEAKLFGKYWKGLDLPRHIVHYDVNSIKKIISDAHFNIMDIKNEIFPSSFIESIGFLLYKGKMPDALYYLMYYPWKLTSPVHTKIIGSGAMRVIAKKDSSI